MRKKEPTWVELRDVLAIHGRLLALHGGAAGLRDQGLMEHRAYADTPDMVEMAALYTAGIVRNHPFADGNKRAGFVAGVLFLELNGFEFTASEEDAIQAVLALAASTLDETGYTAWLRLSVKRRRR